MSADNYFLVRQHPKGGFALVMGFASDVDEAGEERTPEVSADMTQYATINEALSAGLVEYSEYGVHVHPECRKPLPGAKSGDSAQHTTIPATTAGELTPAGSITNTGP